MLGQTVDTKFGRGVVVGYNTSLDMYVVAIEGSTVKRMVKL